MKFRIRKNDNVIEFGANYFSEDILNSLENISGKQNETVKVALLLSLDDLKIEPYKDLFITDSIDNVICRLKKFTRPVKNDDGTIMPRKITIVIEYSNKNKSSCECYLKSLTCNKINESLVDLELEFIGH